MLVEKIHYDKARKLYAEADVVIDQLLVGNYGGFAVEMMKMGKPIIAYIREKDLRYMPSQMAADCRETIINANPSNIYNILCEIIENPSILKKRREAALEYVHRWHDPVYVAGITKSAYES